MALEGCPKCVKYLLFAFNAIFWILGCILLGVGIWARVDPKSLFNITSEIKDEEVTEIFNKILETSSTKLGSTILISFGVIILVIGFLGCCGAIKESKLLLTLYFIALLIIFIALIVTGIVIGTQRDQVPVVIYEELQSQIERSLTNNKTTDALDFIQKEMKCCGNKNGISDFRDSKSYSWCGGLYENEPCLSKILDKVKPIQNTLVGVAVGIALALLLGMISTIILCSSIH